MAGTDGLAVCRSPARCRPGAAGRVDPAPRRSNPGRPLRAVPATAGGRCYTSRQPGKRHAIASDHRMTSARNRIAVYPGTFDPITNGHIDLVDRAAPLFERLIIGVAESPGKGPALPLDLRVELARKAVAHHANVEVRGFDSLLAHFVDQVGGGVLL